MRLVGKIALITGAGSGIGRSTAKLFADSGAKIGVADLNQETLDHTVQEIVAAGGTAVGVRGDVTKAEDAKRMVSGVLAAFGKIDILFNNAGIGHVGALHETAEDDWDRVMAVHVRGCFLMSKYVLENMMAVKNGVIINMSSCIAEIGLAKRAVYAAAKGAIMSLTRSMAVDYAPYGIRVNALLPGTIYTPFVEKYLRESYDDPEEALKGIRGRQLTGELGRPEDVAYAALYVASDEAKFMTGSPLIIDGGVTGGK